jgi:hypothetical protein
MADYAAAPIQPIVQGLLTVLTPTAAFPLGQVVFTGRGAFVGPQGTGVAPGRGTNAHGDFVLTLDPGLPGTAGAVEAVPAQVTNPALLAPAAPLVRTLISVRAPTPGAPTPLISLSVAYGNFTDTVPPVAPGVGLTQVEILTAITGGTLQDPAITSGVEIIVWAGVEQP